MILILIASLQRMRNSSREMQCALVISIFGVKHLFTLNETRTLLFIKPGNSLKKKSNSGSFV